MSTISWLVLAAQAAQPTPSEPLTLHLVCEANLTSVAPVSETRAAAADNSGNVAAGTAVTSGIVNYHAVVDFELVNGIARVRVPPEMLSLGAKRRSGWIDVRDLAVTDREITGTAKIGLLRKARIHIDRYTSEMITENGFRAPCRQTEQTKRAF